MLGANTTRGGKTSLIRRAGPFGPLFLAAELKF